MLTTIEITSRAIRLCRERDRRIVDLETYPVPPSSDPLQNLAKAPLPTPLGRVRLIMSHGDMLLRSMVQPPCPPQQLDRIVRFELQNTGDAEPVAVSWHLVKALGGDDMRLMTMVVKRRLLDQARQALALLGGRLGSLIHPGVGLFQAYRAMGLSETGAGLVVDVGGASLHVVLIQDGELLFLRTVTPGMDDLVKQVGELRGLSEGDAAALVAKLGKGAPDDLHQLIHRQADAVTSTLNANIRFAKAQMHVEQFEPKVIWLAGAGAQVFGFAESLGKNLKVPVRALNPFAGVLSSLSTEQLDRLAELPSPWAVALGGGRAAGVELDALTEDRERRASFWRTQGILRVAAAAVVLLLGLALVRQEMTIASAADTIAALKGSDDHGLVPLAEKARRELERSGAAKEEAAARLGWLDGERRPGRVAVELLSALANEQDPTNCPVWLQSYHLKRLPGQVVVELEGSAQAVGRRSTDGVLRAFEQGLVKRYPPITALTQQPKPIDATHQQFHYELAIADQGGEELSRESAIINGRPGLRLSVTAPAFLDPVAVARVAAARVRTNEETVVVKVVGMTGAEQGASQDITVPFKD